MNITLGIILAFTTMFLWGFGDFYLQRTARKIGDWEALFVVTFFGVLILIPFSAWNFINLFDGTHNLDLFVLIGCGVALTIAALFDLEGMKLGKIAVIEPLWSIEIISASAVSYLVLKESLSPAQIFLIGLLIVCFVLLSIHESGSFKLKHFFIEKGVIFAVIGTLVMGIADFLMGWGARITDPLLINFAANIVMAVISFTYILSSGKVMNLVKDIRHNPKLLFVTSLNDNLGWIAYAFAMSMAPIGIVTALTESSILIPVVLGLIINKEKLQNHQKVGLVGAIVCAVILSVSVK